ncbi:coiled-coil domain-containing protein 191 isoform X2 [Alligator mississippiensis]|uniref:coiled-coil domain-containing protein 191 isoform X2 n=1 Tax=Alligator mississippiensis TaxID=8496 RepID=UPI0006EC9BF8|nr:coiled-coil domain-containing protein 191 isoform X2 [Alligator mississippiensis]
MAFSGLYRWQRLGAAARPKPKFNSDSVEHWIKRVEQASEFAVSEAFSLNKSAYRKGLHGPVLDLETTEQLQDHDEAYAEAQELLNDWMNSKLRLELASDIEEDVGESAGDSNPSKAPLVGFMKYERFDDLCGYLEQELESTTVQDFLHHLLQSEMVDHGILKDLRIEDLKEKQKPRDPRVTMELRHKQVKENRIKHQKELELQRQEKALKKLALSEAKQLVQEENRRKDLKARKEEEEIQREMVKLRKEMAEKRHIMGEAQRMERQRQKSVKTQKPIVAEQTPTPLDHEEEQGKEKQRKVKEWLTRIHIQNQQCLQQHFSAWFKLVLEHRIKMGKARALADWKCQLKALRAWRDYTWAQKLEQETRKLETHLRDQNRKIQSASEYNQRRVLHCCFVEWQRWSRAEAEKRELQWRKEETKKRMEHLLEAVLLGKIGPDGSSHVSRAGARKMTQDQPKRQKKVTETPLQEVPVTSVEPCCWEASQTLHLHLCQKLKHPRPIAFQHTALDVPGQGEPSSQTVPPTQWSAAPGHKMASAVRGCFEHRRAFQQQLIEEQKRQLQEQQELILELQEEQRLRRAKEEAEQATAVTRALNNLIPKAGEEKLKQSSCKNMAPLSSPVPWEPESPKPAAAQNKRNQSRLVLAHPILKAMEERAIQRAEWRRKLEEAKRKREEEKLAQLKAEEEERQRKEAAEKEAQLEKRREEKRQQKLKELEKQRRLEREQQLHTQARTHYEKVLLRKLGLDPWKRLRKQAQENIVVAQRHHCLGLQRKCLLAWLQHTQEILAGKMARAEEFCSCMLLRRGFRSWLKYKDSLSTLEEKASKFHAASLKKLFFWAWFDLVNEEKTAFWEKQKIAAEHNNRRMTLTMFHAWRQYPALMKEEREKEARREELRRRVAEILPDFCT